MRETFFVGILAFAVVAGVGYFLWLMVASLYREWSLVRGVDRLKTESDARRAQRREEAARRLDNGCEHRFGESFGGFPPDTCPGCGLQQKRPPGPCDHVWRLQHEPVPYSVCEKCGEVFKPTRVV